MSFVMFFSALWNGRPECVWAYLLHGTTGNIAKNLCFELNGVKIYVLVPCSVWQS